MRALVTLFAVGAVATSCAWSAALPPPPVAEGSLAASAVEGDAYPKTLVDPLGERVVLRTSPRRIASIALSDDEMLLALVPPERLVGVTPYVDDPTTSASAGSAPAGAARIVEDDPERLLALQADLVVTAGYTRSEPIALLEAAGVPVVGTGALASFDDVLAALTTLGDAVGEPARARALVASLRGRISAAAARAHTGRPAPRVLLWEGGYTYGAGTLPDDVIHVAGGLNVASEAGMHGPVPLTEEAAVALAPEVVIVPVCDGAVRRRAPELVGDDAVWRAVAAVRRGAVYGVPRAWIGSVSQHAVRGLEAVTDILDQRSP